MSLLLVVAMIIRMWHQKYKQQKQKLTPGTANLKAPAQQSNWQYKDKLQNGKHFLQTIYLIGINI